jgi:hypothetical protein
MRLFIIRSFIFLVLALGIVVGVFLFLNIYTVEKHLVPETFQEATSTVLMEATEHASEAVGAVVERVPEEGILLSTLPLTESHKKALSAVNIDVETFVLTKEMIVCAGGNIGEDRIAEIIGGSAPSILEMTKLIPCLGA